MAEAKSRRETAAPRGKTRAKPGFPSNNGEDENPVAEAAPPAQDGYTAEPEAPPGPVSQVPQNSGA
jgi:hypothetical protein